MAALQVKEICMYLELADLPKIINTKLDQGEDRLTQTLVFPKFSYIQKYMVPKCSHSTCHRQRLSQIRPSPDDQNKDERKAQSQRQ